MDAKKNGAPATAANARAALDRPAASFSDLKALLSRGDVLDSIKLTLPKHMKPERMSKILLAAVNKTPALMRVNQLQLIQILQQLSELGLEPGSAWGHVYLIPFEKKKEGITEVSIIIGYKGLIELARRSGAIDQIEANVVFEGDHFKLKYGLSETRVFEHEPNLDIDRTDVTKARAVYCIARLKGGGEHLEVMSMKEVLAIRDNSQGYKTAVKWGKKDSPWIAHPLQMARKTVIRRACNYLPLSAEIREAMELERDEEEAGSAPAESGGTRRPSAPVIDINDAMGAAAPKKDAEPEDAEVVEDGQEQEPEGMDPETGEVPMEDPEPEDKGSTQHLLWRIGKADLPALSALVEEATKLKRDDPLRSSVGSAISARRKALQVQR